MDEETATRKLISLGARFQMAIDPWPIALPILVYAGTYHNEITKNGLTPQAIDVIRVPMIGNEINNNNYSLAFDH
ncbi:MAG: hypothetical protein NDI94_06340, partial [Candidatus Woesearchaeota archaeon]|nr:hypothetical protein [Candidatus Woesearchaeota archaeon]